MSLVYRDKTYSFTSVLLQEPPASEEYFANIWNFCKTWLSGQETFLMHTSGSTGEPKPIILQREQMLASVAMTQKAFGLKGGETALICLHTEYIAGKMMLVRGLELGWKMYIQEPSANPLISLQRPFDFTAFVPMQIQSIVEQSPEKIDLLNRFGIIILGGAAISEALETSISKLQVPVYHTYAMTETVTHIALRRLNGGNVSPYFEVLEEVAIRLDERGCMCVSSPSTLFKEIITNDLAEIHDQRFFRILGRADNIINSAGIKIQPEKIQVLIEKILMQMGIKRRFFCAGIPDTVLGQKFVLCIEGEALSLIQEQEILSKLLVDVSKHHIPKRILYKSLFEETSTGKIIARI